MEEKNEGAVQNQFWDIKGLSWYLGIKTSTLYALVAERKIPHYKVGRLVRFKLSEIDGWMGSQKKECVDPEREARKVLGTVRRMKGNPDEDVDRIVRKAVEEANGNGYTDSHGKPDQVKGLGKEVQNGTL